MESVHFKKVEFKDLKGKTSGEIHSILDNRIIRAEKVTTIIRDILEKMKEPLIESMESICDGVTTDTWVLFNLSTVKGKVSIKWFARSHNVEDVFFCKKHRIL